jgi:thioredoxin-related protein
MRKFTLFMGALFFFLLSSTVFSVAEASSIKWQNYSANVFTQASKEHKLVLLFAQVDWCHWCQLMKTTTYKDADIISLVNKQFIPVKVNIDVEKEVVKKYHLTALPTNIVLDANQNILSTMSGYYAPEQFLVKLEDASKGQ